MILMGVSFETTHKYESSPLYRVPVLPRPPPSHEFVESDGDLVQEHLFGIVQVNIQ